MGWDGDISRMGQLATNIAKLARVPARAAARVSTEIAALVQEEFDHGTDPYGNAWAPLADATIARGRHAPPLDDHGDMRRSVDVRPMSRAGVSITIDHPAAPHQTGWAGKQGSGPARPILPSNTMPARWAEAMRVAVTDEIREAVG